MAPDIEELVNKVNTLTLDKNRLKQKLIHLTQSSNQTNSKDTTSLLCQSSGNTVTNNNSISKSSSGDSPLTSNGNSKINSSATVIAGVECTTSCEEDILYMNDLYKKRIDEYNEKWDYIQSKCTALLSELNALQNHYALLKKEKLDLEEKLKLKDDEYTTIKAELQTVVLNYETQLSAMSEHLSMITSQVGVVDESHLM